MQAPSWQPLLQVATLAQTKHPSPMAHVIASSFRQPDVPSAGHLSWHDGLLTQAPLLHPFEHSATVTQTYFPSPGWQTTRLLPLQPETPMPGHSSTLSAGPLLQAPLSHPFEHFATGAHTRQPSPMEHVSNSSFRQPVSPSPGHWSWHARLLIHWPL